MKTNQAITNRSHPDGGQYALHREADTWEVTFAGRPATFKHELGALHIAYLCTSRYGSRFTAWPWRSRRG